MNTLFRHFKWLALVFPLACCVEADPLKMGSTITFEGPGIVEGEKLSDLESINTGWVIEAGDESVIRNNPEAVPPNTGLFFQTPNDSALKLKVEGAGGVDSPFFLNTNDATFSNALYTVTSFETVFTPSDTLPERSILDSEETKVLLCATTDSEGTFLWVAYRVSDETGKAMTNDFVKTDVRVTLGRVYKVFLESKGYRNAAYEDEVGIVLYRLSVEVDGVRECVTAGLGTPAPETFNDFPYGIPGDWVFGYTEYPGEMVDRRTFREVRFYGSGWVDTILLAGDPVPEPTPTWTVNIVNASGGAISYGATTVTNGYQVSGAAALNMVVTVNEGYTVSVTGEGAALTGTASPYSLMLSAIPGYRTVTVTFTPDGSVIPPMPDAFTNAGVDESVYITWVEKYGLTSVEDGDLDAFLLNRNPTDIPLPSLVITSIVLEADATVTITVTSTDGTLLFDGSDKINGFLAVKTASDLTAGFDDPNRYPTVYSSPDPTVATISGIPVGDAGKLFIRAVITASDPGMYTP